MGLVIDGIQSFFSWFLGGAKRRLDRWWDIKTGEREPLLEVANLEELISAIRNNEIIGERDVKIRNVCVSNFAPLYLCYEETFAEIEKAIKTEAKKAMELYDYLRKRHQVPDSVSLFVEVAKGKISIDSLFREYADVKKLRFLGLSLARFGPISEELCYGAIFQAGGRLKNHTAPLADDVNLESFVPIFYDPSIPGTIQANSYIDAEVLGRAIPLPWKWIDLLKRRGVQALQRPYCLYVPNKKPYYIEKTGLITWMSLDAWINFYVPRKNLNLPFFHRFEPTDNNSRQMVCSGFGAIYDQLKSLSTTDVTFYSDYIQPFIKNVKPVLDMETLRNIVS